MRKIIFILFITSVLLIITGCASGKAIERVSGGPEIEADTYLSRAEAQLELVANLLTEGKMSGAITAMNTAGAYITNADSAIGKIPYNSVARDEFKIRRDALKQRYDFLKTQIK
ncbi:MAG: hypothetical protein QW666_03145 [Candidatus Woesearchaeota archaeon]